ncbi:MAG: peptidoglycan-binding domain-containing protein [Umezawaea sp.]
MANPRRVLALVVGVAVAAGLVGWWVGTTVKSPADVAAEHRPPPASLITVPVEKRVLTSTSVAQGSVVHTGAAPLVLTGVVGSAGAVQLVTKAPVAGTTLKSGDVLMEVSGRPVFVLPGPVPMYRTLATAAKGDDVKQLQAALTALGLGYRLSSGVFDAVTGNAVKAWYGRAGYQAQPGDEMTVPSGEVLFLPTMPVRLDAVTVKAGAPATGQIGTTTDPAVVVQATLPSADAQLVHGGLAAVLRMSDGTTLPATVEATGKDAALPEPSQPPPPPSNTTHLRLVAQDPAALAAYAGQSVKIEVVVGSSGGEVLVVPVAAVVTKADGKARVRVQAVDGSVRDVAVALGLTALGLVGVEPTDGGDLEAGDRVVVGAS